MAYSILVDKFTSVKVEGAYRRFISEFDASQNETEKIAYIMP